MEGGLLKGVFVWAFLIAGMVAVVRGEVFECDNYNPLICTADAIMFCLTNGTIVSGRCYAQRAVCVEKRTVDETFAACHGSSSGSNFDCDAYRTNPFLCTKDLIPFCLDNATVVHGSCTAKQAVCKEHRQVDEDFSTCNKAAAPSSREEHTDDNDGNSAAAPTATVSLLLGLFLSTLF